MQGFLNFIIITIILSLYLYLIQNPPAFVLNFLAPRLHRKIIKKLADFYEKEKGDSKDLEDKELDKELDKRIARELSDVKKTKELVYNLLSKYQDENKNTHRILNIWYKYLKLEHEYVGNWSSDYAWRDVEYEEIREMSILTKAYQDILEEFQRHYKFSQKYSKS